MKPDRKMDWRSLGASGSIKDRHDLIRLSFAVLAEMGVRLNCASFLYDFQTSNLHSQFRAELEMKESNRVNKNILARQAAIEPSFNDRGGEPKGY